MHLKFQPPFIEAFRALLQDLVLPFPGKNYCHPQFTNEETKEGLERLNDFRRSHISKASDWGLEPGLPEVRHAYDFHLVPGHTTELFWVSVSLSTQWGQLLG